MGAKSDFTCLGGFPGALVQEAFDPIALAIDRLLPAKLGFPVGAVGNVWDGAVIADAGTDAVGVECDYASGGQLG